jgi:hypothetical protein
MNVDWNAKAVLHQRDDAGSDLHYAFDTIGEGPLAAMVAQVMRMPPHDRARVVLDVRGLGMLNVGQVAELSCRDDFPRD